MTEERTGYAVIAQALGVDETVLRAITEQWARDASRAPMTWAEFEHRLNDATAIAQRLNNTNLWEHVILESLDAVDIPTTLPTLGVLRLVPNKDEPPEKK